MNRHQQGHTLIELMISLLLGLMLISGFGSLFIQSQKNSTIQRSLSYMMEDGRYILEVFGKELRRTGSLRSKLDISGGASQVFTPDPAVLGSTMSFGAGDYIRGEYNGAGFGAAADLSYNINRLALRYQLNNNTELAINDPNSTTNSPCTKDILLMLGEDPAIDRHVVTLYFYVGLDVSNVPVLYCVAKRQVFVGGVLTKTVTSPAPEPLISNVQKLVITYGVDDSAVPDDPVDPADTITDAANYYVTADNVTDWQRVVAAKLSVVLRSDDDNLTQASVSYAIDGATYRAADKRLYRVSSTTVAFRNQI